MQRLAELQSHYGGVRGQLLAKVWDELMTLKPKAEGATRRSHMSVAPSPPSPSLPSCRACGRTMKENGHGSAVCQNGHTRLLAG